MILIDLKDRDKYCIKDEFGEEAPIYRSLKNDYDVNYWVEED